MRTAFLGTPEAAVPTLEALIGISDVALVVTRPDRPRGRSGTPVPPPVKRIAHDRGIPVAQPQNRAELAQAMVSAGRLDCAVLAAFGMLIRPEILALPDHGIVNVHFSMLPRWRGAAPVTRAMMAGDHRTGVTLMRLDEGLDTGPVLAMTSTSIGPAETGGSLTARLATMGAAALARWLPGIVGGTVVGARQPAAGATVAAKIGPEDRLLDLSAAPIEALRLVRALSPAPGAWSRHDSGRLVIRQARRSDQAPGDGRLVLRDGGVHLGVGGGAIELLRVQPEGRREMAASDWARGRGRDLGNVR